MMQAEKVYGDLHTLHLAGGAVPLGDKRDQEKAEAASGQLAALLAASADALFGLDLDGRLTTWNTAAERLYGYRAEEITSQPWTVLWPVECAADLAAGLAQVRQGGLLRGVETVGRTRSGEGIDLALTLVPVLDGLGQVTGALGLCKALTDRRGDRTLTTQQEVTRILAGARSLREAAAPILQLICTFAGWDVGVLWAEGRNRDRLHCVDLWVRPGVEATVFTSLTRQQTVPNGLMAPPRRAVDAGPAPVADFPRMAAATPHGLHGGVAFLIVYEGEATGVLEFFSRAVQRPSDDLLALMEALGSQIGQFMARAQAEEEIKQRERQYWQLFHEDLTGAFLATPEGEVLLCNEAFVRLFGCSSIVEAIGLGSIALFPTAADRTQYLDRLKREKSIPPHERTLRRPDGQLIRVVEHLVGWCDVAGQMTQLQGYLQDITELKQAQERMLQAERLAVVGEMVTVLSHESRNALQGSQACLELLRWQLAGRPESLRLVEKLQGQQDRLHRLHEDLRNYAAPLTLAYQICDVGETWRKAWSGLAAAQAQRAPTLEVEGDELAADCEIDGFRLEQVFHNLLANALAATPDPVRLRLRCSAVALDGRPAIQVAVRDHGPGLPCDQRERFGQPFVTTRARGTGLGLAICKRIIEAHGGQFRIGSSDATGTEILVILPRRRP